MKRSVVLGLLATVGLTLAALADDQPEKAGKNVTDKAALERARKTVLMLDDIYKTTIVMITDKYVRDKEDYPAGRAAIKLFKQISDKGSHDVRLIDASGKPYSKKNIATDEFDKEGVREMKAGKSFFERVIVKNGQPYLRAMTPVPVVMDKCILCHENYRSVKKGEAIGALTYTVPIE
jgi:Protein of unknown function (DUF3365)